MPSRSDGKKDRGFRNAKEHLSDITDPAGDVCYWVGSRPAGRASRRLEMTLAV